jgi:hypothetical protein
LQVHQVTKVKLEVVARTAFQEVGERKVIEDLMEFQVNKVHVVLQEKEVIQERLDRMEIQAHLVPLDFP